MCVTATTTARDTLNRVNSSTVFTWKPENGFQELGPSRHWPPRGQLRAELTSDQSSPRTVSLNVSFGRTADRRTPWAARFWETDPPPGAQPINWVLGSCNSLSCLEQALALLDGTQGLVSTYAVI